MMDRFIADSRIWPPTYRYWHVYAIPDSHTDLELARLISGCQRVLADYPAISVVPPAWLHCTVQRVGGRPAAERTEDELAALLAALGHTVPALPALRLTAGSAIVSRSAVLLDLGPDSLWDQVHHVVRAAIQSVCGPAAVATDSRPPHVTLGYAQSYQDSDEVQTRLRRVRPSHAPMTMTALHLVEVEQDATRHQYRWRRLGSVRMATARAGGRSR